MISNTKNSSLIAILLCLGFATLLNACKKDVYLEVPQNSYKNYYPVEIGYWIEYQVDSIIHLSNDDINLVDTSIVLYNFLIREQIDSSMIDGEGDTAYIVSRYKRFSDTLPWELTAVWTSKLTKNALERVEDNRRYIRLTFPFKTDYIWNGNAYNSLSAEDYTFEDLYSAGAFSGIEFDSTVTVNQNEFVSNINRINKKEIYGNNVGLIFKKIDSVGVAFTQNGIVILSGLEYEQTVINFKQ